MIPHKHVSQRKNGTSYSGGMVGCDTDVHKKDIVGLDDKNKNNIDDAAKDDDDDDLEFAEYNMYNSDAKSPVHTHNLSTELTYASLPNKSTPVQKKSKVKKTPNSLGAAMKKNIRFELIIKY